MNYYRLTKSLNDIGIFISEDTNPFDVIETQDQDYYISIYKYNEDQKNAAEQIIEKNGYKRPAGVSGINDVVTNKLVFDFDSQDLNKAKSDTFECVERLIENGVQVENINISFSGNKGFSVVVNHDQTLTPKQHKKLAKQIAGDLETFDTKVYNASRIFRLDYTKHNATEFYKTPITKDQLKFLSIDSILNYAKSKRTPKYSISIQPLDYDLTEETSTEVKKTKDPGDLRNALDFSKKPFYLNNVKYALHKGFIPPGKGNEGMMILASTYKHVGFDAIDAYHMLKGVNEKRAEIYGIEKRDNNDIWKQVVEVVYSPNWQGGTYSTSENELLQETATAFGVSEKASLVGINQVGNKFINFAKNINKNVIRTGIDGLDKNVMITTGMMVGILGAPSAGKTALATTIIENLSSRDQTVLFESLDMYDNLLYQTLLRKVSGVDVTQKLRMMVEDDPEYDPSYDIEADDEVNEAISLVEERYRNVEFNSNRGATVESIEDDIRTAKAKHGDKLKLVVIDYLEKVRGPYTDATANSGYVASRLSDLASTYDVGLILLLQPQKQAGDPSEELLSMRNVKGASVIEQDCRLILTIWRPGFNPKSPENDKYTAIAVVKNNMGPVAQLDFKWDGLKGKISELSTIEKEQLARLREHVKEEKIKTEQEKRGYVVKGDDI